MKKHGTEAEASGTHALNDATHTYIRTHNDMNTLPEADV